MLGPKVFFIVGKGWVLPSGVNNKYFFISIFLFDNFPGNLDNKSPIISRSLIWISIIFSIIRQMQIYQPSIIFQYFSQIIGKIQILRQKSSWSEGRKSWLVPHFPVIYEFFIPWTYRIKFEAFSNFFPIYCWPLVD